MYKSFLCSLIFSIGFIYWASECVCKGELAAVSFQTPSTWYARLHESCMQLWGLCDEYQEVSLMIDQQQYDFFLDTVMGHLYFALFCTEKLLHGTGEPLYEDDKAYLCRTIGIIQAHLKTITPKNYKTEAIDEAVGRLVKAF